MGHIRAEYTQVTSTEFEQLSYIAKVKIILDCTHIKEAVQEGLKRIEFHCRRLLYQLHTERYKALSLIKPKRSKTKGPEAGRTGGV